MARNVGDLGLFLDAMAGPSAAEPFAQPDNSGFRTAAEAPRVPKRVAWSADFGGLTPVRREGDLNKAQEVVADGFPGHEGDVTLDDAALLQSAEALLQPGSREPDAARELSTG